MSNGIPSGNPTPEDVMSGDVGSIEGFDLFDDDEIEQIQEHNEKVTQENREIAKAYASIFSTERGRKVLEDLLSRTLRESVYMPERDNPDVLGHIREGQNSIVRMISHRINQGKNLHKQDKKESD